ncbi:MAG: thiamine phosphate synthase [Maricaulaceae bacterium]
MAKPRCRLYLITPPQIDDLDRFADTLEATLSAGDVACLQLRLKGSDNAPAPDEAVLRAGARLLPLAQARGVAALVNDRPDLAKILGADGVHIGQEDVDYAQARTLLGADASIGVTCHDSRHLAMVAGEAGADYVAFGAFFPTATKAPKTAASVDLLEWWSELFEIPCVAIGGITVENGAPLVRAGADFLAVSSGVWNHPEGPATAIRALNQMMADACAV